MKSAALLLVPLFIAVLALMRMIDHEYFLHQLKQVPRMTRNPNMHVQQNTTMGLDMLNLLRYSPIDRPDVSRRPRAAFVYLAKFSRMEELVKSIRMLFDNFNSEFRYPVLLFHDDTETELFDLRQLVNNITFGSQIPRQLVWELVQLHPVTFYFPNGFNVQTASERGIVFSELFPGYHHMISFWFKWVFDHPALQQLDYYMRLDTDSFILSPIKYDLFQYMRDNDYKYGYKVKEMEQVHVSVGLWQFWHDFLVREGLKDALAGNQLISAGKDWFEPVMSGRASDSLPVPIYYNNFEMMDLKAYRNHALVKKFTHQVWQSHSIYHYRWGDAPLRYLIVNLAFSHLPNGGLHEFCDIDYQHQRMFPATC